MRADVLFRNATIVDGNGGEPYVGHLAVADGCIAAIGSQLDIDEAEREIDATGLYLMPGWTDVHCHFDAQVFWDPLLTPSAQAGVTSASAQFLCACWPVRAHRPCARSRHHGQLWRRGRAVQEARPGLDGRPFGRR